MTFQALPQSQERGELAFLSDGDMADSGLVRFLASGIRFATSKAASVYVGLRLLSDPVTSFYLNLPNSLPGSTQALTLDSSGNIGYQSLGGGGSVTSVALSLPNIFAVTGSPVTTSGTLSATFNNQAANTVFAGPNGSSGAPSFRTLVAADIPTITTAKISDFSTSVTAFRLDQFAAPTANISLNNQRITALADPVGAQDAATKAYVDATAQGLDVKTSVKAASTSNLTLSGTQTIDGVALVANDRILVKDQTTGSQNGIYVVAAGAWSRSTDADTAAKVTAGMFVFVEQGTTNADSGWVLTTDGAITLGTTALTFAQFSGAGQITAGAGLTKTGNTLDVVGTANRITANADSIDIASTYVGQASITTLGTITTGVWNGTAIAVANGGTGAVTAAAARTNLSAAGVFRTSFTNTTLVGGVMTITHNLAQYIQVEIYDNNNKKVIPDEVTATSATQVTVDLTSFGTLSGTWNAVVVG